MLATDVFQAIADPTRRSLLTLLADKEMSIVSITECFPISRTAVNKHLHVLSDSGLVSRHRIGRETRYMLQPEPLVEVKQWLSFFEQYWDNKLTILKNYIENEETGHTKSPGGSFRCEVVNLNCVVTEE